MCGGLELLYLVGRDGGGGGAEWYSVVGGIPVRLWLRRCVEHFGWWGWDGDEDGDGDVGEVGSRRGLCVEGGKVGGRDWTRWLGTVTVVRTSLANGRFVAFLFWWMGSWGLREGWVVVGGV